MTFSTTSRRSLVRAGVRSLVLGVSALAIFSAGAGAATIEAVAPDGLEPAINQANASPGADTILLNSASQATGSTYFPVAPMFLTDDVTIKKGGRSGATHRAIITGQNILPTEADAFTISPGVNVTLDNINVQTASSAPFFVFNNQGNLRIFRSSFTGNSGNIFYNEAGAVLEVNNTTAAENLGSAMNDNGGIATFNNSTVLRHSQGGISTTGVLNLNNSVVHSNSPDCFAPVASQITSVDSDGTCGVSFTGGTWGNTQNRGGSVNTPLPAAGNPAINGGTNSICPTVDARFFPRTDATCDIGSYEVGAVTDTGLPTCVVTALRPGPPAQQDVTAQDTGSGLDAGDPPVSAGPYGPFVGFPNSATTGGISDVRINNGTVAYTPFTTPSRSPLVLTATKTTAGTPTQWSFVAKDLAGNQKNCR